MAFPVQVYIAGARPRHLEQSSVYKYKPLCERQIRDGPWRGYRVGDIGKTSWGQLVYDSIIIHISEDGVQSWVRPVRMHTESKSTGYGPKQHWYELSIRLYSVFIKWPLKKKSCSSRDLSKKKCSSSGEPFSKLWRTVLYFCATVGLLCYGDGRSSAGHTPNAEFTHSVPGAAPPHSWCLALYLGFC
jgi:hypothetical protein